MIIFLIGCGVGFVAIWCQLGSNLAAKTLPKSTQVGSKIYQKINQDTDPNFLWFLIGLGTLFWQFCFEVGRPRDQKTLKNLRFLSILAMSANLPTRGHMIDFLINLAFDLAPKTYQNSTQEASKIDQKRYRRYDASWLGIWTPLGTDFDGFYGQVGRQVGAKLAYLGGLILSYLTLSYEIWGGPGWSDLTLVILGILASTGRLGANVWGQQVSLGNTSKGKYSPLSFVVISYFIFCMFWKCLCFFFIVFVLHLN